MSGSMCVINNSFFGCVCVCRCISVINVCAVFDPGCTRAELFCADPRSHSSLFQHSLSPPSKETCSSE